MDLKTLGSMARAVRRKFSMTQQEFSAFYNAVPPTRLTLSQSDISRFEKGKQAISLLKFEKLKKIRGLKNDKK